MSFSSEVTVIIDPHKSKFCVGLLNINSLVSKFDDIAFLLSRQFLDIFVINESKLDCNDDDSLLSNSNYLMFRRNRSSSGGCIILFVKKSIKIESIEIHESFEILA